MHRFFVSQECIKGNFALIVGAEAHHILDVIRLKQGDQICVFDGNGKSYQAIILATTKKEVKVQLQPRPVRLEPANLEITLVQALPKKNKMDYIVEKCTESGVDSIIPIRTARTIVRLDQVKLASRKMRWQKIAQEAAKQSGRTTIPRIGDLVYWSDILLSLGDFDLKLLFSLNNKSLRLKEVLSRHNKARRVVLLIGPEGDFTPLEIMQALDLGCLAVSLGVNVLKSDTAAISALAMVNYELKG